MILGRGRAAPARLPRPADPERSRSDTVVRNLQAEILDHQVMLPAPGQGALALEIHRSLSIDATAAVGRLDHPVARAESLAERGFLAALEAGCTAPVGARARCQICPWYKSRFDSDRGNWENVTEQLVRTDQSGPRRYGSEARRINGRSAALRGQSRGRGAGGVAGARPHNSSSARSARRPGCTTEREKSVSTSSARKPRTQPSRHSYRTRAGGG